MNPATGDGGQSLRVHQLLRQLAPDYCKRFGSSMPGRHRQILNKILRCRTPALGGQLFQCPDCPGFDYRYHSCNDRHCPQCGQTDADDWLQRQRERLLLPTPYFLLTFTVPEELRLFIRSHLQIALDLLFGSSAKALQDLAANPRRLGAQLGMLGVLHTCSRTLMRVLIVEDDRKTAQALAVGLERSGFSTNTARTGEEGFFLLTTDSFDLVVLDWMLPGRDGIEILKTLRARGSKTPVLLLTARDAVEDRVLGLESGADDYLVKPFAFAELVARIRSLLRRIASTEPLKKTMTDLVVDLEARRVWRAGKSIELTPREFDMLAYLLRQPGQIVTREMLAQEVWREANRLTDATGGVRANVVWHSPDEEANNTRCSCNRNLQSFRHAFVIPPNVSGQRPRANWFRIGIEASSGVRCSPIVERSRCAAERIR